jgi:DNA-binding MarR family transcriptional regulator
MTNIPVTELAATLALPVQQLTRDMLADTELVCNQTAALTILTTHPAITAGEMAKYAGVQPPSMTRILTSLKKKGLVRCIQHPLDRRRSTYTVTEEGARRLDRARQNARLARRIRRLTPREQITLWAAVPILAGLAGMSWLADDLAAAGTPAADDLVTTGTPAADDLADAGAVA